MKRHELIAVVLLIAGIACAAGTTFNGRLILSPDWAHNKTGGSSTLKETFSAFFDWTHTTGTNANQMATIVVVSQTLTNGESRVIDLDAATNGFGDTVNFFAVRFLSLSCPTSNADQIIMGNANGTNQFDSWCGASNQTVTINPGGIVMLIAPDLPGYVVDNDGDLKILNSGTNNNAYNLYIGGSE